MKRGKRRALLDLLHYVQQQARSGGLWSTTKVYGANSPMIPLPISSSSSSKTRDQPFFPFFLVCAAGDGTISQHLHTPELKTYTRQRRNRDRQGRVTPSGSKPRQPCQTSRRNGNPIIIQNPRLVMPSLLGRRTRRNNARC